MRLDLYLSRVGIIKRRSIAKEMATIKTGDIIQIGGNRPTTVEIKEIPVGNVKKEAREDYFKILE